MKKIIAVDFDGTLVHNHYPKIENPNTELILFIKSHRKEYTWILWTCRHDEDLEAAVAWLRDEQGLTFDYINQNVPELVEKFGECRKLGADYYIDDKSITLEALKRQSEEQLEDCEDCENGINFCDKCPRNRMESEWE